jgi:hypothetical protein
MIGDTVVQLGIEMPANDDGWRCRDTRPAAFIAEACRCAASEHGRRIGKAVTASV